MPITKEQAIELADKYLLYNGEIALRDNIIVNRNPEGWRVMAKTTPVISGMETLIMNFTINAETGEVGVVISGLEKFSVSRTLKEINERKDLDNSTKEQLKSKVNEVAEEIKQPIDKKRLESLDKWFEKYGPTFTNIISIIKSILSIAEASKT